MSDLQRGEWFAWRRCPWRKGVYQLCRLKRRMRRIGMRVVRRQSWLETYGSVVKGADGDWWYEYRDVFNGSGKGWRTGKQPTCPSVPLREAFARAKLVVERMTGAHTDWARKRFDLKEW
jgi:hypothetical protein